MVGVIGCPFPCVAYVNTATWNWSHLLSAFASQFPFFTMENVHEVACGHEIEIIQITEINFGAYSAATPPHGEALLSFDVCQFGSEIAFLHRVH